MTRITDDLQWIDGESRARCPVCGDIGVKELLARADVGLRGRSITAARCSRCASVVIEGDLATEFASHDRDVDRYVEQFAGIEPIMAQLEPFRDRPIRRFADVGCNYGFGVDIAVRSFGWDAEGFEPTIAARRGAAELTSRVRDEPLVAGTERRGAPFDLVLASEVIEHVPDPARFVEGLLPHLADDGVLVLTTPSAEAIRPDRPVSEVLVALSAGLHLFLMSRPALESLLLDAGLVHLDVRDDGLQIVAVASRAPLGPLADRRPASSPRHLIDYLDALADDPAVAAVARAGAAARHYKQLVTRGIEAGRDASRARLDACIVQHTGHSLDELDVLSGAAHGLAHRPAFASSVLFADGLAALVDDRHEVAARRLAAAVDAWADLRGEMEVMVDSETLEFGLLAAAHLVLALAWADPDAVADALRACDELSAAATPGQRRAIDRVLVAAFVTLVNRGSYDTAAAMHARADALAGQLVTGSPDERRTALDGWFCSAMLDLHRGDLGRARRGFARVVAEASVDHGDAHADALRAAAAEHVDVTAASAQPSRGGGLQHHLDVYWADARGIYVEGFAFVPGQPAVDMRLRWGDVVHHVGVPAAHAGAATMHPDDAAAAHSGFRAHLLGPLCPHLDLEIDVAGGSRRTRIELPTHPIPDWPTEPDPKIAREAMIETMLAALPEGPVVALGTRGHTAGETDEWRRVFTGHEVIAVDIHAGPGIDVVGDGHVLSTFIEPGSAAAFVSDEVFEHVEAPWLVAAEVQRILRVGGVAMVSAPMSWPEHSAPNDFWRASPFGLRSLFGPQLGFSVLSSGGTLNMSVVPGPRMRELHADMPVLYGPSLAYVVARKDRDVPDGTARWPYDPVAGRAQAQRYPVGSIRGGR